MMKSLIEIRRDRVIYAKLDSLMRHVGKPVQLAKLSDGSRVPVELSPEILEKALIKLFESDVYKNIKPERAEKIITDHYSDCMSKAYSKLTAHGMTFMNAVIDELAERAFEKQEGIN
ncbi:hypothetical protein G3601_002542 [Salmonella enterica]|uniref:Uncharacterized protein n=2 Tax=Salmonella enterica TaxID=28901 RepID=A0A603X7N2_SALER|nr:hypothetical protein [Salmonella enterica subsp. enterica serovar Java]EAN9725331.1 hypothetical protein [Salmonella enterica]EBU8673400.1 hypothetical protein [Salmonella enterica subsp. enterica serovar Panama]EBV8391712.1 hypothetical protein [Salmonella enterica subsp. enterica serovar Virchow]ECF2801888.1 hypothetical protein [Salmonella enterica subsp. enterica serovar Miami]ECU9998062.1 hypothetical protein [Salmonella enterica subsp. diarizonae serovar 48:i:z]EDQ0178758.1 hypotheti